MATIRLTAKREGSLLSVIFDREITVRELVEIERLLDGETDPDTYLPQLKERLEGIEQYQAESR